MTKSKVLIIISLAIALIVLIGCYSLAYIPLFEISSIRILGVTEVPEDVYQLLSPLYGVNRFTIDKKKIIKQIEASATVDSCAITIAFPAQMSVLITPVAVDSLLFDGTSYYLLKDSSMHKIDEKERQLIASDTPVVIISPQYASYLCSYGADNDLKSFLSLAKELSSQESNLISSMKYDNNSSNGYGEIVLTLEPLSSCIHIRDKVSINRIKDSIRVIEEEVLKDGALNISGTMTRYDLYSGALVRRKPGGVV